MPTRDARLRASKIILVIAGAAGGTLLPFLTHELEHPRMGEFAAQSHVVSAILVNAGFGALAGWAVWALVAYLMGER